MSYPLFSLPDKEREAEYIFYVEGLSDFPFRAISLKL